MLLSNTLGIFFLGVMTGWVIDVNFISAQSLLLSELSPSQGLATIVAANLAFSFFLSRVRVHRLKMKFSVFGVCCVLPFLLLVLSLQFSFIDSTLRGIAWMGLAIFGIGLFRWINEDLALRHLHPGKAEASFFYLAAAREIGTVLSFLTLRFLTQGFSPNQMVQVSSALILAWMAFVLLQFAPRVNLEIHYGAKETPRVSLGGIATRKFLLFFLLMMFFFGVCDMGQGYLQMLALKNNVKSFESLKDIQAEYYLIASLLIVVLGPLAARWIQAKRSSPLRLLFLHGSVMLVLLAACWMRPVFLSFILLEVGTIVSSSLVSEPAYQMLYSSFSAAIRTRLRSLGVFFFQSLAGLPLLLLLPWVSKGGEIFQVSFWLVFTAVCVVVGILWAWLARLRLIPTLYDVLRSGDKESSILAVQALSYFRPKDFSARMGEVLAGSPKKLLRKTIIVGLGYTREAAALDSVIHEFLSDKEEIQLAVLDALKVFSNYRALQFVVDVMGGRVGSKSLQVRVNAARVIGGIYGKKAIPFLLRGLEDPEPRIIANTLETLGEFRDRKLLPFFEVFLKYSVPRVRTNALMTVSRFRETRHLYREGIGKALRSEDPAWVASALYVVGRLRDRFFVPAVELLLQSPISTNRKIQGALAWALAQWGDPRGYERFGELAAYPTETNESASAMHFFGQLPSATRFEAIQYLVRKHARDLSMMRRFARMLRDSNLDFHRELDYLNLLWQSGHGGDQLLNCVV